MQLTGRLTGLLLGCLFTVVLQAQELEALRDRGMGFAQVTPGKELVFPQDHGAHPDYRIEWWYLTANLSDRDGRIWGLQWTLFRQGLTPARIETGWSSNQVWMAHAAITSPDGHFYEQRFARDGIGQAGVKSVRGDKGFNAWIDDWQWQSSGAELFPAKLSFSIGERDVILLLEATGELVKNGVNGYSQKSEQGQASYYYSQPHIRVRGFVNQGLNKTYLNGQGWLDREWSSQSLADNQKGWDWFSLHLNDGHKLMVYQLRHEDGNHWLSGNWISPHGNSKTLGSDAIDLSFVDTRKVATGDDKSRKLPMEWHLALVEQNRSWRIKPLYDEQWLNTRFPYWEGVVLVEDESGKPSGIGYMELTGYE
jgi:predicted secreted hydrolase